MAKKAYWIVAYLGSLDGTVMAEYGQAAGPAVEAAGGRLIVRGMPAKAPEGGVHQLVVVVEFESVEKAVEAYQSAAYQAAAKILERKVKRDFRIVEAA
jgi:uncharacterized protein (DUF1330 family)